jgi:sugar lactone lactonase YvrE
MRPAALLAAAAATCLAALLALSRPYLLPPLESVAWDAPQELPELVPNGRLSNAELLFKGAFIGPESLVSDLETGFLYTGVLDGRILALNPRTQTYWTAFRFNQSCPDQAGGADYHDVAGPKELQCGRPLGMRRDHTDGSLLVLEAYSGLYRFPRLALAENQTLPGPVLLSRGPDGGRKVHIANDLAVTSKGVVYFTDSADRWGRYRIVFEYLSARRSGRLLEYDPANNRTRVVVDRLPLANGVCLSDDESKVFFAAGVAVWAYDRPSGRAAVVLDNLPGIMDNLRVHPTKRGHYLLALGSMRAKPFSLPDALSQWPRARDLLVAFLPERWLGRLFERLVKRIGMIAELSLETTPARLVRTWQDRTGKLMWLSEAHAHNDGYIYFGSWHEQHLARLRLDEFLKE